MDVSRSFAIRVSASNTESAWQPLLTSTKGLSFTFMKSLRVILSIPFYFLFGKHLLVGKDLGTYVQLNVDGLLESFDYESFGTCEPCLMGKMTKTPFSGTMERANDLLEIIHIDVCGPM